MKKKIMKRINENDAPIRQQDIQVDIQRNPLSFLGEDTQVKELECIDETNVFEVINDLNSSEKLILSYDIARSGKMSSIFQSLHTNNKLKNLTIQGCGDFEEDEFSYEDPEWLRFRPHIAVVYYPKIFLGC
jgi:hypothetical protein